MRRRGADVTGGRLVVLNEADGHCLVAGAVGGLNAALDATNAAS